MILLMILIREVKVSKFIICDRQNDLQIPHPVARVRNGRATWWIGRDRGWLVAMPPASHCYSMLTICHFERSEKSLLHSI